MQQLRNFNKKGASIIEIVVVVGILVTALSALAGLLALSLQVESILSQEREAQALAQETMEAVRSFRNQTDWDVDGLNTIAFFTPYFPEQTGSPAVWTLTAGTETIGIFERQVVFEEVYRDGGGNIVEIGGSLDFNSRFADITVSWEERGRTHTVEQRTVFTNWQETP
ncbi:hypothetical protein KKI17_01930 [Patescibacteria group bacterium]|nr:hypothetical protein [Patescibacteria group bacterium]